MAPPTVRNKFSMTYHAAEARGGFQIVSIKPDLNLPPCFLDVTRSVVGIAELRMEVGDGTVPPLAPPYKVSVKSYTAATDGRQLPMAPLPYPHYMIPCDMSIHVEIRHPDLAFQYIPRGRSPRRPIHFTKLHLYNEPPVCRMYATRICD